MLYPGRGFFVLLSPLASGKTNTALRWFRQQYGDFHQFEIQHELLNRSPKRQNAT